MSGAREAFREQLPPGTFQQRGAAAFDIRYDLPVQTAALASSHIARKLQQDGATLLVPPKSFFVLEQERPLEEKEVRDATCHLSGKIYCFSENLPRCQALSADRLSHIIWRGIGNSSFSVLPFSSSSDLAAHSPRYLGNARQKPGQMMLVPGG